MYPVVRKFIWLLLICLWCVSQAGIADSLPFSQGLLFEVRSDQGAVSHVFGTIHSDDKRTLRLSEPVQQAFDRSHTLCVEVDMAPQKLVSAMTMMFLGGQRLLPDILGPDLYARLVTVAGQRGVPEVALRHHKPWAIAVILSTPPSQGGEFLDLMLYRLALQADKRLVGLESVEEQLGLFDNLSESDQVLLLEEVLNNSAKMPTIFEELIETYLQRDLGGLVEINEQQMVDSDPELTARLTTQLIDDRNLRMVQRLQPYLEQGGVFVAVGALHLPGELGILKQLQTKGFQVVRKY